MKKILAILLTVLMAFTVAVFSASAADSDVAAIGGATYATLADAITNAAANDTITLLADVTEDVTINKNLTIDGANNKYTGLMDIAAGKTTVIQNVNFVNGRVQANKKSTNNKLTVKDCTFEGEFDVYTIIVNAGSNVTIENCTAKNIGQGLVHAKNSVANIVFKDVVVDGAIYGLRMINNTTTSLENVTFTNVTRGVQFQTNSKKTITFTNCTIEASDVAVYVEEKANTIQTLIYNGKNDFAAGNFTFGSSLVNAIYDVAEVNGATYRSIKEAVDAANDGDTVKVLYDHTIANDKVSAETSGMIPYITVADKKVTIDLNGKTITVNPNLSKRMLAVFHSAGTGELTITDSSEAKSGTVNVTMADGTEAYSVFSALGNSKMYIEAGNYSIDKIEYGQSMIYAGQDRSLFVSGGDFYLGNAKTKDPGNGALQPWIFNAQGDGAKVIVVSGGTYNVDPTHYHGEVSYPICHTVVEENGKFAVKALHTPGAEATCKAAQFCTVCEALLVDIQPCTFVEYVSDNNYTCKADGTKTAACIYGCGATHTVVEEGTKGTHNDIDGDKRCNGCKGNFCPFCGEVHSMLKYIYCIITDLIRTLISLFR